MSAIPTAAETVAAAVRILPDNEIVMVTPTERARRVAAAPAKLIPQVGVFDWQPAGDGTYRPVVRMHELFMRMPQFAKIVDIDYCALRRLVTAGFVEGRVITPGTIQVSVHSFFAHVEACKDREFWTDERRAKYASAL